MRTVAILTPAYDCSVDAYYHHSVIETVKACAGKDIEVCPLTWPGEALVQHARDALVVLALSSPNVTDCFWIDADQEWRPEQFTRLLDHPVHVVGATYRKKTDEAEQYTVRASGDIAVDPKSRLCVVSGLGTGFLRVSREAMQAVYDMAKPYTNNGQQWRAVFEVGVIDGRLHGEDTMFCEKLRERGFPVHLDTSFTVGHNGYKRYKGDFQAWAGLPRVE